MAMFQTLQQGHVTITCIKSRSPHPLTFSISTLVTTSLTFAYDAEGALIPVKFLTWIQFNSTNSPF